LGSIFSPNSIRGYSHLTTSWFYVVFSANPNWVRTISVEIKFQFNEEKDLPTIFGTITSAAKQQKTHL